MELTGNLLRQQITKAKKRKESLENVLQRSLYAFEDELDDKADPSVLIKEIEDLEFKIVKLQSALATYNNVVTVTVDGRTYPLVYAVKGVGAADRCENRWMETVAGSVVSGIFATRSDRVRDKDAEVAQKRISDKTAMDKSQMWSEFGSQVRAEITKANTVPIKIERLGLGPEDLL